MANPHADRNLLMGILALQLDFVSREGLVAAMNAWVIEKSKSLGEILYGQGMLNQERLSLLNALVAEHLKQHNNDTEKSLAAISSVKSVRADLERVADPEMHASLAHLVDRDSIFDPGRTTRLSAGQSTSAGQRFRALRPHARGGLGEVFVAMDEELHREVALKEIQERYADDDASRARFVLEAEITGGLEHPGIVPVYGLGAYSDGRPFYAMRFIRGDSLEDAIKRFHAADEVGRDRGERTLQLRKLLGRFIEVCNAIEYAHSRGVLHRDLKPANVMLGRFGETLVVDWGLAKPMGRSESFGDATEASLRPTCASGSAPTQMGVVIGTPAYMSPEQAAGRLDLLSPASDVYSLGTTLYSLLTGQAPLQGGNVGELLHRVQRGEIPPPQQVKKDTPAALQAICLKAMSLKSEDRYPAPRLLADDLEHWLADEPVAAHVEHLPQRMSRFARRHRAWAQAAAVALLVITAVSLLAMVLVNQQRKMAQGLAEEKELLAKNETAARLEAERNSHTAREVLNFLTGLLKGADPLGIGGYPFDPADRIGRDATMLHLLDAATRHIKKDMDNEPAIKAQLLDTIGHVYATYSLLDQARPLLDQALVLRTELFGEDSVAVAETINHLAFHHFLDGDYRRAEAEARRALAVRRRLLSADHSQVLESELELAWCLQAYFVGGDRTSRLEEAERLVDSVIGALRSKFGEKNRDVALAMIGRAAILASQDRLTEATKMMTQAASIYEDATGDPRLGQSLRQFIGGTIQFQTGRFEGAAAQFRSAIATTTDMFGPAHPVVSALEQRAAYSLASAGRNEEAEKMLSESLTRAREACNGRPRLAWVLGYLADFLEKRERWDESEPLRREALKIRESTLDREDILTTHARIDLVHLLMSKNQYVEAQSLLIVTRDELKQLGNADFDAYIQQQLAACKSAITPAQ